MSRSTAWQWVGTVLAVLGVYLAAYGVLRQQRVLVRTGWFLNIHTATGGLAPEAGWRDCAITRPGGGPPGRLEAVFAPAIAIERAFWSGVGRQCKAP